MLREEAVWIRRQLAPFDPSTVYPMCNLGSSTLHFRKVQQPYIDAELFAVARRSGWNIVHVDLKPAPGIDVVGDFSDDSLRSKLRSRNFRSVMCCNLLEHVVDRQKLADFALSLVQPGGFIIVTVPNYFPYHEDPIDTMYRPDIEELASLFGSTEVVSAEIVRASRFIHDMNGSWVDAFWLAVRVSMPFYRPARWLAAIHRVIDLLRGYRVTCLILRRLPSN